jgi:tetratricopeptide (TPR) repeat protein
MDAMPIFWTGIASGSRPIRLGQTPYETNLTDVIKTYVKSNSFLLELKKTGHKPYRVLLAKTEEVDLELTANLELDEAISNHKEHDLLMNQLFDVQKLIRGRNFKDALAKLNDLEIKHPTLSIIPELKATSYYMNKEVENALSYYRKAFALNPDNSDAYRMKVYLEKKLGVDSEVQ